MMAPAFRLEGVSKRYVPPRTIAERVAKGLARRRGTADSSGEVGWALKDITLDISAGACVGLIGLNGSGKTTLLEIIAGTLAPTTGRVERHGRVAALLELGSGFNPELTGTDNVLLNGMVAGLSRREVEHRFDDIARFADIGDVLAQPVKTYSSGMLARLAFALHTVLTPDILIVDEILAVGDYFFQQKCHRRLAELREAGVTQLFVSHDLALVRDLCEQAAYLRQGRLAFWGGSGAAIHRLLTDGPARPQATPSALHTPALTGAQREALPRFGDAVWQAGPRETGLAGNGDDGGDAGGAGAAAADRRLAAIRLCGPDGQSSSTHRLGSRVRLQVWFRTWPQDRDLVIGLAIKNRYDQTVTSVNSHMLGCEGISHAGEALRCFEFDFDLMLEGGQYSLRLGLNRPAGPSETGHQPVDGTGWFGPVTVAWDYPNQLAPFLGMFGLPMTGRLGQAGAGTAAPADAGMADARAVGARPEGDA